MENSGFGRLISVFTSPGKTFASIAQRPTWIPPVVVVLLLSIAASAVVMPRMDMRSVIRQSIEDSGRDMTPEQIDMAAEKGAQFGKVFAVIGIVFQPILFLLLALIFWVVFKLAGGDFSFPVSFSVVTHGLLPGALAALLTIPVVLSKSTLSYEQVKTGSFLTSNLAAFAPPGTKHGLLSLLSSVDVFSLWSLVLLVIGYRIAAKVSKASAIGVVVGLWAVYVLCKAGFAAAFG